MLVTFILKGAACSLASLQSRPAKVITNIYRYSNRIITKVIAGIVWLQTSDELICWATNWTGWFIRWASTVRTDWWPLIRSNVSRR